MKIDFSVIIPVYNVEQYIEECINSILPIRKAALEIIIIDDCSPDKSVDIIQKKFRNEDRITIVCLKENKGLSGARNEGIKRAKGEYIIFIDSDDLVEPSALETLCELTLKESPDVTTSGGCISFNDTEDIQKIDSKSFSSSYKLVTGIDYYTSKGARMGKKNVGVMSWLYIYKKNFLCENELWFIEKLLHEDIVFFTQVCLKAGTVLVSPIYFYYYRQRLGSITSLDISKRAPHLVRVLDYLSEIKTQVHHKLFRAYVQYRMNVIVFDLYRERGPDHKELGKKYVKVVTYSFRAFMISILGKYFPELALFLYRIKLKIQKK